MCHKNFFCSLKHDKITSKAIKSKFKKLFDYLIHNYVSVSYFMLLTTGFAPGSRGTLESTFPISILVLKEKVRNVFFCVVVSFFCLVAFSPGRVMVTSHKIVINLSWTYENQQRNSCTVKCKIKCVIVFASPLRDLNIFVICKQK